MPLTRPGKPADLGHDYAGHGWGGIIYQKDKEIDPMVKVLLSCGYSLDGEAQEVMSAGANGFIQKPYRLTALSHKVAEILS